MKYNVIITEPANEDFAEIAFYIKNELNNLSASDKFINEVLKKMDTLSEFPYSVPVCNADLVAKLQGFRVVPINNYIIVYRINEDKKAIVISRILFARRDWLNILK